ncbi:hypothetical protein BGZ58_000128 [Dissophora ornata]|nr:hypothetical protein BGZ58_000128 [Dissophora ornata]
MGSAPSHEAAPPDHEHYRTMARKSAVMRQHYSEQSQTAYRSGNGAKAKAHNQSRPRHELDLHGLKVREAIEITRVRLAEFVKNKEPNLIIIVGQGRNSMNGIAKIKPAVTELVKEYHVKATPNKPNQGCIYIEHLPKNEDVDYSWIGGFFSGMLKSLYTTIFG